MSRANNTPLRPHDIADALAYITGYWDALTHTSSPKKSTHIKLPHPYVVPSSRGGTFAFEEQYYWDSYFIALGIDDEQLATGMLDNLIYMFKEFGLVPNGSRHYLTSRSQPPVLTPFIFHLYEKYGKPKTWLKAKIAIAKKEYTAVWMSEKHPAHHNVYRGLSRYYDINRLHDFAELESGWDMTPRFKRQCLDYLPIDLNSLLYQYETDFARAANILGHGSEARIWEHAANERRAVISDLMWHKRKAFFFDYNYTHKKLGDVWSLAGYYTMWTGLASDRQAHELVRNLHRFIHDGGLTTTTNRFLYSELFGSAQVQWAYPNCWAPLQYIVCEGLERYGYADEARAVAQAWLKTCNDWYLHHGEFIEKYNAAHPSLPPVAGRYPTQPGFGWTNGVFNYLAKKYVLDQ